MAEVQGNRPQWKAIYESPVRLLVIISVTIFVTHTLAMEVFSLLPKHHIFVEIIVESFFLIFLLFPILYFYSFRPLIVHIRERNQAQEVMRESEYKYRTLFENLSDAAFLTVVETGRVIDTNRQGEYLVGLARSEILGMNHGHLFPEEQAERTGEHLAHYASDDSVVHYESVVFRKNGTAVPVHISGVPITLYGKRLVMELFREDRREGPSL